ncbi:MAG: hypothetical protein RML93_10760, partial [Anaerolineales bacterium]|nr:hypothetical protein [Anaerolineales bacterium]MDW8447757.1 hypothetical protein [Anaerolineales bacterium]
MVIALLAWIAFVLGGYYLYHKPFALEQLLVWTRAAYQTVVCAAILLSAGGLGVEILSRLGFGEKLSITKSTGLGLGVLATVFLGLGSILGVRWFFSTFLLGAVWIACRRS